MAQAFDAFAKPHLINKTARYREIARLDQIYEGKQYDGRPDWWTGKRGPGAEAVPLRQRKPCIIYRLPKAATQQVVRFLFGEKRFPKVAIEAADESAPEDTTAPALNSAEGALVTAWLGKLVESANIEPTMRAIAAKAIACKTAPVIVEVDRGEFRVTLPSPQDCWVKFADDNPTHEVERLLWCYEFEKEVADEAGSPTCKRHVFRREWDVKNVYTYEDAELRHGAELQWGAPTVTPHGLSFCPVLWIRNEPDYSRGIDGRSLYEDQDEEFEALDMALSRRHQGIIYLGAPQLVETGVEPGDGPSADGNKAGPPGPPGYTGKVEFNVTAPARRIAPDSVWTYEGKEVDVKLVETSGKAFEVGTAHVNDIRSRILETMGVVITSMADTVSRVSTGAEMSARFLALAHAPLIALVQEYRHSWWPHGLRPLLSMLMRMTVELSAGNQEILVPGTAGVLPILSKFKTTDGWRMPPLRPHWGRFFEPSNAEIKEGVDGAVNAKDGHLVAERTAIEFVAHDFGVDDIEAELELIEEEKAAAQEREDEQAQRELDAATAQIDAKTRVGGPGANASGDDAKPGDPGGRPKGGKDDAGRPAG